MKQICAILFLLLHGQENSFGKVGDSSAPDWVTHEIQRRHAVVGENYVGKISAYASGSDAAFGKVSGPDWLLVSPDGKLSGVPGEGDAGSQAFGVEVSNAAGKSKAVLRIEVYAAGAEAVGELKVMTYNAWHGWGKVNEGYRKGLESIVLSGADVIGMQESTHRVNRAIVYQPERLAKDLGWYYRRGISGSLGILSRYPIIGDLLKAGPARGARILLSANPRREVILMNCHLDPRRYGPYAAQREGASEESVLKEERASQRDEQIAVLMKEMKAFLEKSGEVPVFLTGDFNSPSHLDWTTATAKNHGGVKEVAWPVSVRVVGDGMRDSYRGIHPKPEVKAGNTWSPIFKENEAQDRIDFVYYQGQGVTPLASEVFTTAVEKTVGKWGANTKAIQNNSWPSDHAAVITTFRFR